MNKATGKGTDKSTDREKNMGRGNPEGVLNRNFGGGVLLVLQKPDPVLN